MEPIAATYSEGTPSVRAGEYEGKMIVIVVAQKEAELCIVPTERNNQHIQTNWTGC